MKKFLTLLILAVMPLALNAQNPGFGNYRNTALSSTAIAVKSSQGGVYGFTFINPNTTAVYLKFYNSSTAIVGTTTPIAVIMVPAGDGTVPGCAYLAAASTTVPWEYFLNAISIGCVTAIADNSTAAPASGVYVEVLYK